MLITEWIERFNPCNGYFYYKEIGAIRPHYSVKRILYDGYISVTDKIWLIGNTLNTVGDVAVWRIDPHNWRVISYNENGVPFSSVISTSDLARFMEEIIDYIGEQEDED